MNQHVVNSSKCTVSKKHHGTKTFVRILAK